MILKYKFIENFLRYIILTPRSFKAIYDGALLKIKTISTAEKMRRTLSICQDDERDFVFLHCTISINNWKRTQKYM